MMVTDAISFPEKGGGNVCTNQPGSLPMWMGLVYRKYNLLPRKSSGIKRHSSRLGNVPQLVLSDGVKFPFPGFEHIPVLS